MSQTPHKKTAEPDVSYQLADAIAQHVWMLDETGAILWQNRRWYAFTGAESQAGSNNRVAYIHPDHAGRIEAGLKAALLAGREWEDTLPLRDRNGEYRWFLSRCLPLRDEAGRIVRWLGTDTDITRRHEIEQALLEARDMAEAANMAKSEFLLNISHEIRTPLNAVLGISAILEKTALDEKQKQMVSTLHGSAGHLLELINDVLDFARLEEHAIELENAEFDLRELVEKTMGMIQVKAREKSLALELNYDTRLPGRFIGDGLRIQQILTNLLGNAVKFTEKGRVTLSVEGQPLPDLTKVKFRISDTGIGIAPEKLEFIFEKFTQVNASMARKYDGSGLGLSICKSLAELMQGRIEVTSEPGKGSTFSLVLPLKNSVPGQASVKPPPLQDTSVAAGRHHRILLVEDHAPNVLVATMLLEELGYDYDVAVNGFKALEKFAAASYAMVFMDVQMPEIDGLETTRRIRTLEAERRLKPVPIVALTGHASSLDRDNCLRAGMQDYVAKPFRIDDLRRMLNLYVRTRLSH